MIAESCLLHILYIILVNIRWKIIKLHPVKPPNTCWMFLGSITFQMIVDDPLTTLRVTPRTGALATPGHSRSASPMGRRRP